VLRAAGGGGKEMVKAGASTSQLQGDVRGLLQEEREETRRAQKEMEEKTRNGPLPNNDR
jgi:hypothetical protein